MAATVVVAAAAAIAVTTVLAAKTTTLVVASHFTQFNTIGRGGSIAGCGAGREGDALPAGVWVVSVTLVPSVVEAVVVATATTSAIATVVVAARPGMKMKGQVVPTKAMMNLVARAAAAAARPRFQSTNKYLQTLIFLWRVFFVLVLILNDRSE